MALRLRWSPAGMRLIIVKRGAWSTFHFLEQSCKGIAALRVVWDRRRGPDRRSGQNCAESDSRMADRRGKVPHSWAVAGHVLAEGAAGHELEPVVAAQPTNTEARQSV